MQKNQHGLTRLGDSSGRSLPEHGGQAVAGSPSYQPNLAQSGDIAVGESLGWIGDHFG
jgi:hypothetical protein